MKYFEIKCTILISCCERLGDEEKKENKSKEKKFPRQDKKRAREKEKREREKKEKFRKAKARSGHIKFMNGGEENSVFVEESFFSGSSN